MRRLPTFVSTALIIGATVLVTEAIHYQLAARNHLPAIDSLSDLGGGDLSVTESEFGLYVATLEAMHENHGLSVQAAAESQGMSLDTFRDVERRVQANDVLVERTRDSLKRKAESVADARYATVLSSSASPVESDPEL